MLWPAIYPQYMKTALEMQQGARPPGTDPNDLTGKLPPPAENWTDPWNPPQGNPGQASIGETPEPRSSGLAGAPTGFPGAPTGGLPGAPTAGDPAPIGGFPGAPGGKGVIDPRTFPGAPQGGTPPSSSNTSPYGYGYGLTPGWGFPQAPQTGGGGYGGFSLPGWGGTGSGGPDIFGSMGQQGAAYNQAQGNIGAAQAAAEGQIGAANAGAYGQIGAANAAAGAARDVASTNANAQQNVANTTASANRDIAQTSLEGANYAADKGLAGQQAAADAQRYVAQQGLEGSNYAADKSLAAALGVANIQNQVPADKLALFKSMLSGPGGLSGALGINQAGGDGSTSLPGTGTTTAAAPVPTQPRFNPLDEQRLNSRSQSILAQRLAGQKNALADQYGALGLQTGGRDWRNEVAGLDRTELSQLLDTINNTRRSALEFNQNGLQNAKLANDFYNQQQQFGIQREQNRIAANNPLYAILASVLG